MRDEELLAGQWLLAWLAGTTLIHCTHDPWCTSGPTYMGGGGGRQTRSFVHSLKDLSQAQQALGGMCGSLWAWVSVALQNLPQCST